MAQKDELISFSDEEDNTVVNKAYWNILVVDDDAEVHSVTTLALRKLKVLEKNIEFIHAYSAREAKEILSTRDDIAVILLDVVMETDDAGLKLVNYIRSEQKLRNLRIILRTGQPGSAPEVEVIQQYEIDDYEMKSELTRTRLVTSITTAIRSYHQLSFISINRDGLKKIIDWGSDQMSRRNIKRFTESVLKYIINMLRLKEDSLYFISTVDPSQKLRRPTFTIVGALGKYSKYIQKNIVQLEDENIAILVDQCLINKKHILNEEATLLYIKNYYGESVIYLDSPGHINDVYVSLLEIFCSYSSICFENVKLFEKLNFAAYYDELTNLPNRLHCIEVLDQYSLKDDNQYERIALLDVEHFHDINVSLGQHIGEQLLIAFSQRLTESMRQDCYISRIGSHSFGVIGSAEVVTPEKFYQLFSEPLKFNSNTIPVSLNIGICDSKHWDNKGIDILRKTSVALEYANKQTEKNHCYYESRLTKITQSRLQLMHRLKQAFVEKKLQVWYQPQVDLSNNSIVGVEALLRWQDENNNFIPPFEFIPVAEQSGLIIEIGAWVLEKALADIKAINRSQERPLKVSVNVSVTQFKSSNFLPLIKRLATENNNIEKLLELEITESVVMDNYNEVISVLDQLKEFGIELALDDFGTGFSSLSYLSNIPFDILKIDRAFVHDYQTQSGRAILNSIILLGKQLRKKLICEGIETKEQAAYLKSMCCEVAQGFLYYKPMPFDDFQAILSSPPALSRI